MLKNSIAASDGTQFNWPPKFDVLGVRVSATNYSQALDAVMAAARRRQSAVVSHFAVHAVVSAAEDRDLCEDVNSFEIVAPDGQPVRWALKWLYKIRLTDRCYGPEMMDRVCRRAATEGVGIYLYGSTGEVLTKLCENLSARYPGLEIAGSESPPFRVLTPVEEDAMVTRINGSGAGIVFIGLGCPKQDRFAARFRNRLQAVQICVGAAFDFHAGTKKSAPSWMQRRGLEWLFRLGQEPGRLWKRYLTTNSIFVGKLAGQIFCQRVFGRSGVRVANVSETASGS
jgi:N-acetylglucosaminyldiphosphoundecaprenol N-acetyl-beta-D-mannosaminyltransferase